MTTKWSKRNRGADKLGAKEAKAFNTTRAKSFSGEKAKAYQVSKNSLKIRIGTNQGLFGRCHDNKIRSLQNEDVAIASTAENFQCSSAIRDSGLRACGVKRERGCREGLTAQQGWKGTSQQRTSHYECRRGKGEERKRGW
eukprot:4221225-Pleurochrysis_carterae.AAC.3